jgi:uncharacterized membrane protein YjjB (DUF3815 family)
MLVLPFAILVCIQLKGHMRQVPMMYVTSLCGFVAHKVALFFFAPEISYVLSAFVIGVVSNIYARKNNDIAIAR